MMLGPFTVDAYWVARTETARSCAARLRRTLTSLAGLHPAFYRWNKKGMTRSGTDKALWKMPPRFEELTELLNRGRHFKDSPPGEPIPDLGFSIAAWNGIDGPTGISLQLNVGAYWRMPNFPNHVELKFRRLEPDNADLINAKSLKSVLLTLVESWEPSWASVANQKYWEPLYGRLDFPPFRSGWMTYLSGPYAEKISTPPLAIAERVEGGILLLSTVDPFSVEDSAHVEAADSIQTSLAPLQANPLLLDVSWRRAAGFGIFLQRFRNERSGTFDRTIFEELFGKSVVERDSAFLRVRFPDKSGGDIFTSDDDRVFPMMFTRCGGEAFFRALYELAKRTRSIVSWPADRSFSAVIDRAIWQNLPSDLRARMGLAKLVSSGSELEDYVFSGQGRR